MVLSYFKCFGSSTAVSARFCRPVESIIFASRPAGFESRKRGHVSQKSPAQRFLSPHLLAGVSLAAIIFFGLAAPSARAQNFDRGWEWQNPLPQGNAISAVRFTRHQRHGLAIGADGV